MSCKSAIYVVNTTTGTALASGASYVPQTVVRRFGPSIQMAGNGVTISGAGYYDVEATVTVEATAAGTLTASLYKDNVPVVGATASVTAVADTVYTLPINALVRQNCNCSESNLTIELSGVASTSVNLAWTVEKE